MSLGGNFYQLDEHRVSRNVSLENPNEFHQLNFSHVMEGLQMQIVHLDDEELEFDILGVDPPLVNGIRRILIAEIPTLAIDKINLFNNTSVIPDEVLAHRLGLVPIKIDPRAFIFKDPDGEETEEDSVKFELKVKCYSKPGSSKDMPGQYMNDKVYSSHLKFIPIGNQKNLYGDIRPVKEDILLAVLKPGHEIDLEAFCFKNIGREHAKFSPVVVASYRLMPQLIFLEEISGEKAHKLAEVFPDAVTVKKKHGKEVVKVNHRKVRANRNILLHEDLKEVVQVVKKKDHYIFTVESAGAIPPEILVTEAINILRSKCAKFLQELKSLTI